MSLQSIQSTSPEAPKPSALQNTYKAFDLAKTLAGLYGNATTVFGTKAPNFQYLNQGYAGSQPMNFNSSGSSLANFYNSLGG